MAIIPVLVVRQLFSWPLGHDSHGQHVHVGSIISDGADMAYALAHHPEKVVRSMHEIDQIEAAAPVETPVAEQHPFDE